MAVPFGLNAVCLAMVLRLFLLMPYPAILVSRVCGIPKRAMADATKRAVPVQAWTPGWTKRTRKAA